MNRLHRTSFAGRILPVLVLVGCFVGLGRAFAEGDPLDANQAASTTGVVLGAISSTQDRAEEIKQTIATREEEIKALESEIAEYRLRLDNVGKQRTSLQGAISSLDLTRSKLSKDLALTEKRIDRTELTIRELDLSIKQKELLIAQSREAMGRILRAIDERDGETMLESLLKSGSITAFLSETEELDRMQSSIRDTVVTLERLRVDLGSERTSKLGEQNALRTLSDRMEDQKTLAEQKKAEQQRLLKETKNQEANYKKLLADKESRKSQYEREVADFEAQLRAVIDPSSFPTPGTKVFAYPLESVTLTQRFGRTSDARRLYASGTHNGIDMRAAVGTSVRSAGDGVVVGLGDTDQACRWASYGKWVMVEHPNGLSTLYGHLDLIKSRIGDQVRMGDLIGYSGNTGYSTGPHLHFSVYVSSAVKIDKLPSKSCPGAVFNIPLAPANAYLDPEDYL
jgi:murein DD-endopeptidase MepM/ murein hydrolase activator NlpD